MICAAISSGCANPWSVHHTTPTPKCQGHCIKRPWLRCRCPVHHVEEHRSAAPQASLSGLEFGEGEATRRLLRREPRSLLRHLRARRRDHQHDRLLRAGREASVRALRRHGGALQRDRHLLFDNGGHRSGRVQDARHALSQGPRLCFGRSAARCVADRTVRTLRVLYRSESLQREHVRRISSHGHEYSPDAAGHIPDSIHPSGAAALCGASVSRDQEAGARVHHLPPPL